MRNLTPLFHQRGLALVETAITLPFLLFVMLASTEFTNAFVEHTTLTKAVRDGARYAAEEAIDGTLTMNLSAALRNETRNLVVYGNTAGTGTPAVDGLTTGDVTVSDVGGNNIEVSVNYAYTGILGSVLPSFGYGSDHSLLFNLRATVTMRAL
ncbi:MAG: pilus assembly protein [Gammaproteobacteria bacterium]|nr:pilus assembly protein [Gammaproteobacteria bacterium]NNL49354.1 pilus assembly protein [Woeseiaceae bacterium]